MKLPWPQQSMMEATTLETVLNLVKQLSPSEKTQLIAEISAQLQSNLASHSSPRKSLRGLWQGVNVTETNIAEARREMWKNFPREEI